jgi:predicted nucleic acid-binding protein
MSMAERIVIDASVAMALLVNETGTSSARAATASWSAAGIVLLVPSYFWIEVTNALVRRHGRSTADAIADLVLLDDLALDTVDLDRPTLLMALDHMERFRLSAYDAMYLALALSTDATLATFDRRLAGAAGARVVVIGDSGPHRLAEPMASYEDSTKPAPSWARSAVVGAHIAELRRRVIAGNL